MTIHTLRDLFVEQLQDIYDAEHRIAKALPRMAKVARSGELKNAFENHLAMTEEHAQRLEQVFESIGETPKRHTCKAIVGLLDEGEEMMKAGDESVVDAALIAAAQKIEHYEMATYGCLRTWADLLGADDAANTLQLTLDEEGHTDHSLTEIARSLNIQAAEGDDIQMPERPRYDDQPRAGMSD
ncbi:MAG TPA: ferritin-like domain-containing protein [Candidatus Eisenbacteria bacterium]|nr:ferritin-like domain-containing protein [Candidatus Eisenbacteria bacterium]